jgi:hypothetical protein
MRRTMKQWFPTLAILLLTLPVWAGAKRTPGYVVEFDTAKVTTIGSTQIQPGSYKFEADPGQNTLEVLKLRRFGGADGETNDVEEEIVAQIPCYWIQLLQKAPYAGVTTDHDKVIQVEFDGKTEALQFK